MERAYKAFISYRHRPLDVSVAKRLHKYIEHYTIPKALRKNGEKHPGLVFRDQDELPLSGNLSESIRTALDRSEYLIVVCTPETANSQWVLREITYFIETHGRDHVLAVLADGDEKTAFPTELTCAVSEDGGVLRDVEPLAANLVAPTEAKRAKLLKTEGLRLIAALIGCNYDELYRREQRYRRRQTLAAVSAVALASGIFSVTMAVKNAQITRQNEQISRQNTQITAQKEELADQLRQTQLNESKNMTALSRIALRDGDFRGALDYAYRALPTDDPDRPYCPEAEAQLSDVLSLYRTDCFTYVQSIEQETTISELALSPDGSRLATRDALDRIRVFDCATGQKLWEKKAESVLAMRFTDDGAALVCYSKGILALSAEDGAALWEEHDQTGSLRPMCGGLCLLQSADGLEFFLRDAVTGEVKASVALLADDGILPSLGSAWAISDSGKTVAAFSSSYTHGNGLLIWDTERGAALLLPLPEYDFGTDVRITFVGEDIALAAASTETSVVTLYAQAQGWTQKFTTEIPIHFDPLINGYLVIGADISLFGLCDGSLLYAANRTVCAIDPETGAILAEKTTSSAIMRAEILGKSAALLLNDGLLTMYTAGNLTHDAEMYYFRADQTVSCGEIAGAHPLSATYATVFRSSKNRVSLLRYKNDSELTHLYEYPGAKKEYTFFLSPDRSLLAGIRYHFDSDTLTGVLIELGSGEASDFSVPMALDLWSGTDQNEILLSDDAVLYLNKSAVDLRAQTLTLLDDNASPIYISNQCLSAYDREADLMRTAYLDPDSLALYITDGQETKCYPFQKDFLPVGRWAPVIDLSCEAVTANGCVLLSRSDGIGYRVVEQLFLFDPAAERWTELPADAFYFLPYKGERLAACSEDGTRIALPASDGGIVLLDSATGAEVLRIDCPADPGDLGRLLFAQDDTLFFAFSLSGTMYVYDAQSGGLLFEESFPKSDMSFRKGARCDVFPTQDGKRLVLVYDSSSYTEAFSVVIDPALRCTVGEYAGIIAYVAERNTLILAPYYGKALCEVPLYSISESLSMAEALLNP